MTYRTWTKMKRDQGWTTPLWRSLVIAVMAMGMMAPAQAGDREQAKRYT